MLGPGEDGRFPFPWAPRRVQTPGAGREGRPIGPPAWRDTREGKRGAGRPARAGGGDRLGAQNWEALLGSHCSSRTMDGSLLAPRMNSSRDSLPAGRGTVPGEAAPSEGRQGGQGPRGGEGEVPAPALTVVIRVHLAEDLLSPLLWGRLVLRHLHHGRNHLVNGLGVGGEGGSEHPPLQPSETPPEGGAGNRGRGGSGRSVWEGVPGEGSAGEALTEFPGALGARGTADRGTCISKDRGGNLGVAECRG